LMTQGKSVIKVSDPWSWCRREIIGWWKWWAWSLQCRCRLT
jgi:hypothetical protein